MATLHGRVFRFLVLAAVAAGGNSRLATRAGYPAEIAVSTADGLRMTVSPVGALERFSVENENLLPGDLGEFHPLSVCDVTRGDKFVPGKGKAVLGDDKTITDEETWEEWSLRATIRYSAGNEFVKIKVNLRDTSGEDRGLLLRFALPIRAEGWRWWDDMETARTIGAAGTYEHCEGLREFASLPEWRDKPALNMGAHAVNFCNAITGPVGLCYAVPLDEPRIFRTGYDAAAKVFYIVYDVGLAKETEPPGEAQFTFYLYRCDPAWGMRSALDRYYRLFPQFFTNHVARQGAWMAFSKLSEIDNVNEFCFAFQEGAPEPGYDDRLGVDSLTYFTHAGMFANIPDYRPETDPEPSYERQLAAMRTTFRSSTGSDGIFDACGLYDAEGKLSIKRTAVYGHVIAQFNLEPRLPYGAHLLGKIPETFRSHREKRGGELDGFYYDGITTGVNYRREHFKYAHYPPTWNPVHKKPFLFNYFSSVAFAKAVAERLHADGKVTMMNGAMGSSFYTAPYLDVMGAETGLRIDRASFNYVRTICRQKPFVTLLKGNFSQLTGEDFALYMKRCVAYGVFPGFFDWPPSGLGPGSRYWDHAEWYERDRPNHRKYQALCRQLAEAGWEPLTLARSSEADLGVERFGKADGGEVFFTVLNERPDAADAIISIPAGGLPKDSLVVDEVALRWLPAKNVPGGATEIPLHLGPESLAVLHVAPTERLVTSHAGEILKNLALRRQMQEIDADRPEYLVHWRPLGDGAYERGDVDGRPCLKLANLSDNQVKGVMQWVMLYQERPTPLRLRLRLKCDKVTPSQQGKLFVDAVLCHVNMKTHFTEQKREKFDLDPGTYDWRETEILIRPERPLRSIQLSLSLSRCSGTVWIDEISVAPAEGADRQYAVDPKMQEWYRRPDAAQKKEIDSRFAELESRVKALGDSPPAALRDACLSILGDVSEARKWIRDNKLDNPCRRALRELDDMAGRLSLVASALMGVRLRVDAPAVVVPGEGTAIRVRVEGGDKPNVRYAIRVPEGWQSKPAAAGDFVVTAPGNAVGTVGAIVAAAEIGPASGPTLPLVESVPVRVAPNVEASMRLADVSASGDGFRFAIDVSNNGQAPAEVSLKSQLPEGWRREPPSEKWTVDGKSTKDVGFCAIPSAESKAGRYDVRAEVSSPKLPKPIEFAQSVFFLPASFNLLKNPGFEAPDRANWAKNEGASAIDESQSHGGKRSLVLRNASTTDRSSASQTIALDQKTPRSIVVRGHAKAENVSGHPGGSFSVYVDIYYTDGTPLYGQTIDWQTGTTGWQYGEMVIEPAKAIRHVNVYLLLRGHSGTAWFDDIFVAERP